MSTRVDAIRGWAARLADLHPRTDHPDDVSLLGIMAGALYSLVKAEELSYQDARGQAPDLEQLASEFRTTLKRIGNGDPPPRTWQGGFYFVSALVRLSPLLQRLGLNSMEEQSRVHVREDVNWFKHSEEQHPVSPMRTSWDDALSVAHDVYEELESLLKAR
jgi:hypothetical protein